MNIQIIEFIKEKLKMAPIDHSLSSKIKQHCVCLICNKSVFTAPNARIAAFKKSGSLGCVSCNKIVLNGKRDLQYIDKLSNKFINITPSSNLNIRDTIQVTNKVCNHSFATKLSYLIYNDVYCPICDMQRRKNSKFVDSDNNKIKKKVKTVGWFLDKLSLNTNNIRCINPDQYTGVSNKLNFLCSAGHTFETQPRYLIYNDSGCPECKILGFKTAYTHSSHAVLKRFNIKHNNLYTYPNIHTEYKNMFSYITILCKTHGKFLQKAYIHVSEVYGQGCPSCAIEQSRLTKDEFLSKATTVHGLKYEYDLTNFIAGTSDITIFCKSHGAFIQNAATHIHSRAGCPTCGALNYSQKAISWLNGFKCNIRHAENGGEFIIPTTKFKADGYDPDTNTVYEFHGSAFHGDPTRYSPSDHCHPYDKTITAGELYEKTINRENLIKSLGYNLVTIWESEYDKNQTSN